MEQEGERTDAATDQEQSRNMTDRAEGNQEATGEHRGHADERCREKPGAENQDVGNRVICRREWLVKAGQAAERSQQENSQSR